MDLDVVGSRFLRREHFRRGKCADDRRNPIPIAELDRCVLECWRDDVLGSGQNGDARSLRIKDRTGSDLQLDRPTPPARPRSPVPPVDW